MPTIGTVFSFVGALASYLYGGSLTAELTFGCQVCHSRLRSTQTRTLSLLRVPLEHCEISACLSIRGMFCLHEMASRDYTCGKSLAPFYDALDRPRNLLSSRILSRTQDHCISGTSIAVALSPRLNGRLLRDAVVYERPTLNLRTIPYTSRIVA